MRPTTSRGSDVAPDIKHSIGLLWFGQGLPKRRTKALGSRFPDDSLSSPLTLRDSQAIPKRRHGQFPSKEIPNHDPGGGCEVEYKGEQFPGGAHTGILGRKI